MWFSKSLTRRKIRRKLRSMLRDEGIDFDQLSKEERKSLENHVEIFEDFKDAIKSHKNFSGYYVVEGQIKE